MATRGPHRTRRESLEHHGEWLGVPGGCCASLRHWPTGGAGPPPPCPLCPLLKWRGSRVPAGSQNGDSGPPGSLLRPGDSPALTTGSFPSSSQGWAAARPVPPRPALPRGGEVSSEPVWETSLGAGRGGRLTQRFPIQEAFPHFTLKCHCVVSKAQEGASGFRVMKSWLRILIPSPPTWVNLGFQPSFCKTQITTPDPTRGKCAAQSWPAASAYRWPFLL